jgi:hypothetical protein
MAIKEGTIQAVWKKGRIVPGYDPNYIRKDQCGAWIILDMYGNRNSSFGWEIDHLIGDYDNIANLRPLQWENNSNRNGLELVCVITSCEVVNIKI